MVNEMANNTCILYNEEDTKNLGIYLSNITPLGGTWLLCGDLGVGKTTFVRGFVLGLGGDQHQVSSPTYAITHQYSCLRDVCIHHLDLYRLNGNDMRFLGLESIFSPLDYVLVEWGHFNGPWPTQWIAKLDLSYISNQQRMARWTIPMLDET